MTLLPFECCGQQGVGEIFTDDGAWCWFQDPRAVYINGDYERTYAQWMTQNGKLLLGAYDHDTGKTEIYTLHADYSKLNTENLILEA